MKSPNYPQYIEQTLGAFVGPVLDTVDVDSMKAAHKELLELDGITFPSPDLLRYIDQWDANAALHRGDVHLRNDGLPVDMKGFDQNSETMRNPEARLAISNNEKLRSLVDLSILAKAGDVALALANMLARNGREDTDPSEIGMLNESYKHYVQLAMATERWAEPWQRFVAESFGQQGLEFPLDDRGVRYAISLMSDPAYKNLDGKYFRDRVHIRFNMYNALDRQVYEKYGDGNVTESMIGAVALIGIHYSHSPDGAYKVVEQAIEDGNLDGEVVWRDEIEQALDTIPNWQS